MLDRKTLEFLKVIKQVCGDGSYKVLDVKSLIEDSPKRLHLNEDVIKDMVKYLEDQEYIDVKYSEKKVYCLAMLTKARVLFEQVKDDSKTRAGLRKLLVWSLIISGVASFLGAFLAVIFFG